MSWIQQAANNPLAPEEALRPMHPDEVNLSQSVTIPPDPACGACHGTGVLMGPNAEGPCVFCGPHAVKTDDADVAPPFGVSPRPGRPSAYLAKCNQLELSLRYREAGDECAAIAAMLNRPLDGITYSRAYRRGLYDRAVALVSRLAELAPLIDAEGR